MNTHLLETFLEVARCESAPSGIYNVRRDSERVSNRRFTTTTGWHPGH